LVEIHQLVPKLALRSARLAVELPAERVCCRLILRLPGLLKPSVNVYQKRLVTWNNERIYDVQIYKGRPRPSKYCEKVQKYPG
jgi:hypothetical protein